MKTGALRLNHQRPLLASSTNPKSGNGGKQEPASTPGYMTDFRQLQGAPHVPSVPLASVTSGPGLQGQTAGTKSPDQPPSWLCDLEQDSGCPEASSTRWA